VTPIVKSLEQARSAFSLAVYSSKEEAEGRRAEEEEEEEEEEGEEREFSTHDFLLSFTRRSPTNRHESRVRIPDYLPDIEITPV